MRPVLLFKAVLGRLGSVSLVTKAEERAAVIKPLDST